MAILSGTRNVAAVAAPSRRQMVRVYAVAPPVITRRVALGSLVVGPLLGAAGSAPALDSIAIEDHTFAKKLAVSLDEMRDGNANFRTRRNAFQGAGADLTASDFKRRAKEAAMRVADVGKLLVKDDNIEWSKVYQDLHNATGTLRYDMSNLIASLPNKEAKKAANKLSDDAMKALEQLDLFTRKQNLPKAREWHAVAAKKLQDAAQPLLA